MAKPDLLNPYRGQPIEVEVGNDTLIELPPGSSPQDMMNAIVKWHQSPDSGKFYDPRPKLLKPINGGQYRIEPVEETLRDKLFNKAFDFLVSDSDDAISRQRAIRRARDVVTAIDFTPGASDALLLSDAQKAYNDGDFLEAAVLTGITALGIVPVIGDAGANALKKLKGNKNLSKEVRRKLNLWHGSPHKFDAFDLGKIGTGEGAQAFGSGLYLAEDKAVADFYREQGARGMGSISLYNPDIDELGEEAWEEMVPIINKHKIPGDIAPNQTEAGMVRGMLDDYGDVMSDAEKAVLERYASPPGSLYNVEVDVDPDSILDWEKPLSEQPNVLENLTDYVAAKAAEKGGNVLLTDKYTQMIKGMLDAPEEVTGMELYSELGDALKSGDQAKNQDHASKILNEAGVPGHRYLDAHNRGQLDAAGSPAEGTRNFVIYDDKSLKVVSRNGQPVTQEQRKEALDLWHGSPHKFDEFDLGKMGSGEGAQAQGWGSYLAENQEVAGFYKDLLSTEQALSPEVRKELSEQFAKEYPQAMADEGVTAEMMAEGDSYLLQRMIDDHATPEFKAMVSDKTPSGYLYNVKANLDPDTLIDWDAHILDQSEAVQGAIEQYKTKNPEKWAKYEADPPDGYMNGQSFYKFLSQEEGGQEKASKMLNGMGLSGVRYYDGSSKGGMPVLNMDIPEEYEFAADEAGSVISDMAGDVDDAISMLENRADDGDEDALYALDFINKYRTEIDQTMEARKRNYVVFDSDLLEITHRNGEPLTKEEQAAIDAWHGSPHKFDEFSLEKIGTGEGNQSYGHGLYFTETRGIAEDYAKMRIRNNNVANNTTINGKKLQEFKDSLPPEEREIFEGAMSNFEDLYSGGHMDTVEFDQEYADDFREMITQENAGEYIYGPDGQPMNIDPAIAESLATRMESIVTGKPAENLYEVGINANKQDMLDWDLPMSVQPEKVRNALTEAYNETMGGSFEQMLEGKDVDEMIGIAQRIDPNSSWNELEDDEVWDVNELREQMIEAYADEDMASYFGDAKPMEAQTGESVYKQLATRMSPEEISALLNSKGIPGIRYDTGTTRSKSIMEKKLATMVAKHGGDIDAGLAEFMRGVHESPAEKAKMEEQFRKSLERKESNLVIFDDSLIDVRSRNGEPITPAEREEVIQKYYRGSEYNDSPRLNPETGLIHVSPDEIEAGAYGPVDEMEIDVVNPFDPDNPEHLDLLRENMDMEKFAQSADQVNGSRTSWLGDSDLTPEEYFNIGLDEGGLYQTMEIPAVTDQIKALGFDAVQMREYQGGVKNLAVFSPDQITKVGAPTPERLLRAREQGFNTSLPLYHGTPAAAEDIDAQGILPGESGVTYLASDPNTANYFTDGPQNEWFQGSPGSTAVFPYYTKAKNFFDPTDSEQMEKIIPDIEEYAETFGGITDEYGDLMPTDQVIEQIKDGNYEYMELDGVQHAIGKNGFDGFKVKEFANDTTWNYGVYDTDHLRSVYDNFEAAREVQRPGAEGFDPRFLKGVNVDPRKGEIPKLEGLERTVSASRIGEIPEVSIADYEGRGFISHYADRMDAGVFLEAINGEEFDPVNLLGGQDFMFDNLAAWAGDLKPANMYMRLANEILEETGQPPLWLPWRMAPTGSDFNTSAGETMIAHASANMRPGVKRSLNAQLKKLIPGFKSVDDPMSIEMFRSLPRVQRDRVVSTMDKGFREKGGLSISQARMAVSAPNQINAPQFGLQNIGEIDPKGTIERSTHNTYPYTIPGQGLGVMKEEIEIFDMIPEYLKAKNYDRTQPEEGLRRSLEMNPVSGIISADLLKRLGL